VAARSCFMALGSDTGGSIRIPAQVIGRPFEEATILKVALAYEGMTDWTSQAPPI